MEGTSLSESAEEMVELLTWTFYKCLLAYAENQGEQFMNGNCWREY
jgi:hypothetical protein